MIPPALATVALAAIVVLSSEVRGDDDQPRRPTFSIVVDRGEPVSDLVPDQITVNGSAIGGGVENNNVKIPAGTYTGKLRYFSKKGFVQGPLGTIGNVGDFLLEVAGVDQRTDILFHGGTKPEHSLGCILLGGVAKDSNGVRFVPDDTTLRKLRLAFYGTDTPTSTPDVDIVIVIRDATTTKSDCDWTEAVPCIETAPSTGKRCGKQDSVEVEYHNKCPFATKVVLCLEKAAGAWLCDPDGKFDAGTKPDAKGSNYVCSGTGAFKVYAMPIDKFLAGHCKYPKR